MTYIDSVQASSANHPALMQNEHVRVWGMKLKAGEKDQTHLHPSGTAYFVKGAKVKIHMPNGEVMEADIPDGHITWHDEWIHQVENVGRNDFCAIIV